jgi:tetratricopeptide (TPR) repeat protein
MSTHSKFVEQRLHFAKDLLRSGNVHRAISICEELLSPAAMLSHGKEIFSFIADAVEQSGNREKASNIRMRSQELFGDVDAQSSQTLTAESAHAYLSIILPELSFPSDMEDDVIIYDDISFKYSSIPTLENPKQLVSLQRSDESKRSLTALEELAKRLEHAKIPVIEEDKTLPSPSFMPSVVTETMADIYEQQGAYAQAIKAYQVLARNNPQKLEYFESKIAQLRLRQ